MNYCPCNGWDCPYFGKEGVCSLDDPKENCDDYAFFESEGMLIAEGSVK